MRNCINRVMERETEIIMKAMGCDQNKAEWYKENRDELIPGKFLRSTKRRGIKHYDADSFREEDIVVFGPDRYEMKQKKAEKELKNPDYIKIENFRIENPQLLMDMAEDPYYKLVVQDTANEAFIMQELSSCGINDPSTYLVEVDKKKSILYLYHAFNMGGHDLACAKSMVPSFEVLDTMFCEDE